MSGAILFLSIYGTFFIAMFLAMVFVYRNAYKLRMRGARVKPTLIAVCIPILALIFNWIIRLVFDDVLGLYRLGSRVAVFAGQYFFAVASTSIILSLIVYGILRFLLSRKQRSNDAVVPFSPGRHAANIFLLIIFSLLYIGGLILLTANQFPG